MLLFFQVFQLKLPLLSMEATCRGNKTFIDVFALVISRDE
jgi:hypothetical protein